MSFLANIGRPYIPQWQDLGPFIAECWLILTIIAVLMAPFFSRKSNSLCAVVSLGGMVVGLISLLIVNVPEVPSGGDLPLKGILIADHFALLWKAMLLVFVIGIVLMWFSTGAASMHEGDGPEFFTLLLGATLGMCLMASTNNLLMLFMAIEMASLPSYVMAGFRKTHRLGAEASLKYVLFGAATSAIMAFGLSILYGLYGTLDVVRIAQSIVSQQNPSPALLTISICTLIVGVGFKVSAVPFHFWCPDVFEGASIEVSAFLSVASKGAALALLLRVCMSVAEVMGYQHAQPLTAMAIGIGVIGAITCTVGNTAAFAQNNIKRLLAYSSIAHAGYMLCIVSLLYTLRTTPTVGGINEPANALLFYLAVYLFMNLGAFTVAGLVWRQTGSEDLSAFNGLGRRSPLLAGCMFLFLISLIGLPPVAGFIAKLNVLLALINNGGWWWWLVIAIGVNSVISAFYYFRVIKAMYVTGGDQQPAFVAHPLGTALATVCAAVLVLMFILTSPMSNMTRRYGKLQGVRGSTTPQGLTAPATQPTTQPTVAAARP